ncbi:MAG TPA: Lrp/AsnC family transcriptional regulator [Spirochaetes bacterium]|nr:Lrp/AsnC family transcriptional regulator [Spirochaetota bacterium]
MKLDSTDLNILQILEKNGRTPNNEIAARVSISEGTVRNRIKKLIDSNILVVKGLTNPEQGSDKQLIFILVQLEITKNWKEIARKVSDLKAVKSVSMITGRFDLIIELYIEPHNLINFLTQDLASVGNILSTESLVTIKNFNKWV